MQEAEEITTNNLRTLEESQIRMSDNTAQERKEMSRKGQLKQKNDKLNDQSNFIHTERIRVEKDIQRIQTENQELLKKLTEKNSFLETELNILKESLKNKEDKLDKITKKLNEKEVDLEDMNNHLTKVQK